VTKPEMATGVTLVDVDDDDEDDPGSLDEHAAVRSPRLKIIALATSRPLSDVPNTVFISPGLVGWEVHILTIPDAAQRQRVGGFILRLLGYRPGRKKGEESAACLRAHRASTLCRRTDAPFNFYRASQPLAQFAGLATGLHGGYPPTGLPLASGVRSRSPARGRSP
jgi:hypothetical protein